MARQCAFCGSTANLSKEHVWPKWAAEHLSGNDGFERQDPQRWDHKPFDLTVKAVCKPCNNGWMASLEVTAKNALFESAFAGRGRLLHGVGQRTLAAWALKTAMMVEQTNAEAMRGIPRAEYAHLYERGEPSAQVRVWVASYVGSQAVALGLPFGKDVDMDAGPDPKRGERDVWGSTVLFGPVVFQVIGTGVPGLLDMLELGTPNTYRLWPYQRSFTWLPSPGMDERAVFGLHSEYLAWIDSLAARGPD